MVEKQNNKEVSSSVQIICKNLNTERQKSLIETSKKESLHGKLIDNNSLTSSKVTDRAITITYKDKEKGIIRKGRVKYMLERIENQQTNSKDGTLCKGLDIGNDIVKQRNMTKKEKKDDSLEKTNNSLRNNDDSSKERQNNEIIRRKLDTKEIERDSPRIN